MKKWNELSPGNKTRTGLQRNSEPRERQPPLVPSLSVMEIKTMSPT